MTNNCFLLKFKRDVQNAPIEYVSIKECTYKFVIDLKTTTRWHMLLSANKSNTISDSPHPLLRPRSFPVTIRHPFSVNVSHSNLSHTPQ